MKSTVVKNVLLIVCVVLLVLSGGALLAIVSASPPVASAAAAKAPVAPTPTDKVRQGDAELAYLLVKLELKTRGVMAGHYARAQSSFPGVNTLYKRWLAKNMVLPAAVADKVFAEVVPQATSGRAWVKMIVDEPRNPNNRGDDVSKELFAEIKAGAAHVERATGEAHYYAEPIKTNAGCLYCHGEPAGEADPAFPQFKKNGWKEGQVVGAVVARVAPLGDVG